MVLDNIFNVFPLKYMGANVPRWCLFKPQLHHWQDLCEAPCNIDTYLIYKLWVLYKATADNEDPCTPGTDWQDL